ncbi:MAG TPA: hypothetical protein VNJ12_07050 [Candidatus Dormibacteraeota bacterium]|nr:hypothetical protein [Candidatus Dormibacteraeota bacterium]
MRSRRHRSPLLAALALAAMAIPARGMAHPRPAPPRERKSGWWARVGRAQASQPHWITPVAVVTPLLAEEFRFDEVWQTASSGATTADSFDGKGLELIPTQHIEVIAGVPAYFRRSSPSPARSGWGDFPMLVKYRMFSAPSGEGNYVLTAFFGATLPTGTAGNGAGETVLHPALAFGKGWGDFDVQGTFGAAIPVGTWRELGTPLALNAAFQYHIFGKFWPEVEINSTAWPNGTQDGKKETFLTPGLVIGRFPLWGRAGVVVGGGVQIAVTHFHRTNHNLIFTIRLPF